MGAQLSFDDAVQGEWMVVTVTGEVDQATTPPLREHLRDLIADGHPQLLVDIDQVGFINASGLGVLVGVDQRARAAGGRVELRCTRDTTLRLLRITGLDRRFPIHSGRPAGTERARGMPAAAEGNRGRDAAGHPEVNTLEVDPADLADQQLPADPLACDLTDEEDDDVVAVAPTAEADPADAADQRRPVPVDENDPFPRG